MASRIGLHILGHPPDWPWLQEEIRRVRPAGLLLMEGARDPQYWPFWAWCRANGIKLLYRPLLPGNSDPEGAAAAIIDLVQHGFVVDAVQGRNENDARTEEQANSEADFDLVMADRLGVHHIGYAPYMAYTITMERQGDRLVNHYLDLPKVRQVLTHPNVKYLITHEYWHHSAEDFLDWPKDRPMPDVTTGQLKEIWVRGPWGDLATWWVGRCQMWHWYLRDVIPGWNVPVWVGEGGVETYSNAATKPPWGGERQGGFRSYTNVEDYLHQTRRVDTELLQRMPEVAVYTPFTYGTNADERWDSYDYSGLDARPYVIGLGDHIIASRDAQPEPIPPPPVPPPPEPLGNVEDIVDDLVRRGTPPGRSLDALERIIVHHTASVPSITPEAVANWHVLNPQGPQWLTIAYHFFISQAGEIFQTLRLEEIGNHAGSDNDTSIGIVLAGAFHRTDDDGNYLWRPPPPNVQLEALEHLVEALQHALLIPDSGIKGHYEVRNTLCPGREWVEPWRDSFLGIAEGELDALRRENAQLRQLLERSQVEIVELYGVIAESILVLQRKR